MVIKMTERRRSSTQCCAVVSQAEGDKIDRLVEKGLFINRADLVRSAVRELLEGFKDDDD